LHLDRRAFCRLLWQLWSPNWTFDEATFARSAASFDNPDFVDVTIHSYRHRYGNAAGDPALEEIEKRLAAKPKSRCRPLRCREKPTTSCRRNCPKGTARFSPARTSVLLKIGHNPPQEAPGIFADAVLELARTA
jgi:pimeloyl-ACP methyl ester carboxylesterase